MASGAVAPAGDIVSDIEGYVQNVANRAVASATARVEQVGRDLIASPETHDAIKRAIVEATPAIEQALTSQTLADRLGRAATAELQKPENQRIIQEAARQAGAGAAATSWPLLLLVGLAGAGVGAFLHAQFAKR